ncbi:uncharacterized protein LOC116196132 [Punica granatum]|uniref:Uncharacterized protein LOC116196132 n=1 Tax=Punica granatum TaxID=22663 RepID=A0A6P8CEV5_PUNGR|nr:uncharacterized protein LOC116196132 [Punica granatum]
MLFPPLPRAFSSPSLSLSLSASEIYQSVSPLLFACRLPHFVPDIYRFSVSPFVCWTSPFLLRRSQMGKQSRAKKSETIGKGKVTPVQIAFIVDRYLSDNNFTQTRSVFRTEAASLIAKSPVHEAPRGLLSLEAMLNEYISLKEQKAMVDQERIRLEQERWRIQTLLQGMQEAMNAYNSGGAGPSTPAIQAPVSNLNPQSVDPTARSPPGCLAGNTTPGVPFSAPSSQNVMVCKTSSSQLMVQPASSKRKVASTAAEGPSAVKKSRSTLSSSSSKRLSIKSSEVAEQSNKADGNQQAADPTASKPSQNNTANGSVVQGSGIAKRLFYPPQHSTPAKSSGPATPPRGTSSRSDQSTSSSIETSSAAGCSNSNTNTPEGITPTHCTMVSYEKITVSPFKQIIERGQCISSSPAKRVKGRLDFNDSVPDVPASIENDTADNTSTSESEKETDQFDWDFPNLDAFGANFFTDLLVDLDLDGDDINFSSGSMMEAPGGKMAGLPHESSDKTPGVDQLMSEYSATVTEIHSERDVKIQGVNNVMAVKSVTRCTSVLSPAKRNPGV